MRVCGAPPRRTCAWFSRHHGAVDAQQALGCVNWKDGSTVESSSSRHGCAGNWVLQPPVYFATQLGPGQRTFTTYSELMRKKMVAQNRTQKLWLPRTRTLCVCVIHSSFTRCKLAAPCKICIHFDQNQIARIKAFAQWNVSNFRFVVKTSRCSMTEFVAKHSNVFYISVCEQYREPSFSVALYLRSIWLS